jgi:hypothetical protein
LGIRKGNFQLFFGSLTESGLQRSRFERDWGGLSFFSKRGLTAKALDDAEANSEATAGKALNWQGEINSSPVRER